VVGDIAGVVAVGGLRLLDEPLLRGFAPGVARRDAFEPGPPNGERLDLYVLLLHCPD
jgi:hypothetical protein